MPDTKPVEHFTQMGSAMISTHEGEPPFRPAGLWVQASDYAAALAAKEESDHLLQRFLRDIGDDMECLPTCDEEAHDMACPVTNPAVAWRMLREAKEAAEREAKRVTELHKALMASADERLDEAERELAALRADADANAPWLTAAHMLCTDAGVPQGRISDRIAVLRELTEQERKDAERYRWTREQVRPGVRYNGQVLNDLLLNGHLDGRRILLSFLLRGEAASAFASPKYHDLDAAIDAALRAEPGAQGG